MKLRKYYVLPVLLCFVFCMACSKKYAVRPVEVETPVYTVPEPVVEKPAVLQTQNIVVEEPSVRSNWARDIRLENIYFAFDSEELTEEAKRVLNLNADILRDNPDITVIVEGHTDERGTIEYNLALGQRRAMAVRQHYMRQGIAGNKIATISFGRERPVDPGHNEAAWARNRRAETKVKAS